MLETSQQLLIVDDDEMTRDLMSKRLSLSGFELSVAEDGYKAIEVIAARKFNLILLDISMPGLSGLDVLKKIRETYSMLSLPVIMVTAYETEEYIIKALEIGANDYLVKPLNMQIALARINAQLTLNYLSKVKDEFVSFASHDLKKPLMLMLDIATLLKQTNPVGSVFNKHVHEDLEILTQTIENMQNVIEGFLNSENLKTGKIKLQRNFVNLNELVNQIIKSNNSYAQKKEIQLVSELDSQLPKLQIDKIRIMEVLDNLIGNSIKFSNKGAKSVVRTYSENNNIYTEVCDTGPGLLKEEIDDLFINRSKISNKPTGGETSSGLGLAICKELVTLHGGNIGVKANGDKGTIFWFSLPIDNS